ncbi:oligoendopeptidase F [Ktedonospora formicarum]|uniref:Oligopeptidase F n=2 Tax=Ktedonospora formicarum TaxID=2778364 RepID=A0A8J3MPR1_9CHLR|nr:oligoendopeptidase F [Ktedonospora formicarum]GHO42026.1 oligoendopeptidase F [Ktedonospora formicarum]
MPKIILPPRSAQRQEDTWDIASVFPNTAAWEAEYQQVQMELPAFEKYHGKLNEPTIMAEVLDAYFQVTTRAQKLSMYAELLTSVDTSNEEATALISRAATLNGQVSAALAFIKPELLANGAEKLSQWANSDSRLAAYTHYLEDLLRLQAHVRSPEIEELLGALNDPFTTTHSVMRSLTGAEIRFQSATSSTGEEYPVAQGTTVTLWSSTDRETRRTAWENYHDGYLAFKKTLAHNLEGQIKQNIFFARAHGYRSALEARLAVDHIPVEVYHNVIDTFRRNLSTWHRYWALRRRVLGYKTLHTYDLYSPLTTQLPALPYTQAVDLIAEGLQPLGDEYIQILRRGCLQERWVDIYPNQGKRLGAFSSGSPGTHPFIFMSYDDSLKGMSTLAHELGHSMHSYLTWQTQPLVYSDYSMFVAETASNFHQAMVRAHLLRTRLERDFQIGLLDEAMNNFHRYYFIMPLLARLELEMYERVERGEALTADILNGLFADFLAEGYGSEVEVDAARDGITWATFGHLYANFYVFQYTTGIAAANALARSILASQPQAVERYLAFLRTGNALYPLDVLQQAGVDLRTPEPIEATFTVLADYVERLEQLTSAME